MAGKSQESFEVTPWVHRWGGRIERHPRRWERLGRWESACLGARLRDMPIEAPAYISGLARAGTTILLEIVASHPAVVTHQYRDYPFIHTPYWWNWLLRYMEKGSNEPVERAHGDGILITPASPEAMEEVLWMHFFPDAHRPHVSNVLDAQTSRPEFEQFYRDHVAKLLLVRGGTRYASKGNYNVTRLAYLQKIFPDARFVLPVREPSAHVASLIKQHRLFHEKTGDKPQAREHLRRVGHYEFGPDRTPINAGDDAAVAEVLALWDEGQEVRGWARYWAHIYSFVADQFAANDSLRDACLVVRYEDLCGQPREWLEKFFAHLRLEGADSIIDEYSGKLHLPTYYRPDFTEAEQQAIAEATRDVAARFGYVDQS